MTETTIQTSTTSDTTTTPRTRLLEPGVFYFTFLRALRSELAKLTASRGFWLTSIAGILYSFASSTLNTVIMTMFTESNTQTPLETSFITSSWSSLALFIVPLAVLSVSSEYSQNTMHTTILSVPKRSIVFTSKLTAVFIYCGTLAFAMIASSFIAALAFSDSNGFAPGMARALIMEWLILSTLAIGTAGITFLIRSTAGSIVLLVGMLKFLSFLTIIPHEKTQTVLHHILPDLIADATMNTYSSSMVTVLGVDTYGWSWQTAFVLWCIYMAVFVALGVVRFIKSDA